MALGALYTPSVLEGVTNNCAAVERQIVRKNSDGNGFVPMLAALSNGNLAAMGAAQNMPNVPAPLACAVGYWNLKSKG